jgi:hypothetical protein
VSDSIDPTWRALYAATLASSFAYADGFALDASMADDVLAIAIDAERETVEQIAADRGPLTADRWRRAALEILEARLAAKPRMYLHCRRRCERHVEALRLDLGLLAAARETGNGGGDGCEERNE